MPKAAALFRHPLSIAGTLITTASAVVFIAPLRTPVCGPPMSMQAAQLALKVNIEAATATAMSEAAITGVDERTEANIAAPAKE